MERHGFIHDILDVKVLILYVMSLVEEPVTAQTIYELCYQDECLTYFDVQEAVPQMVASGHLEMDEEGFYSITDKGREAQEFTQDAVAFPVKQRAKTAVEKLNCRAKREQFLRTEIRKRESGDWITAMALDDLNGAIMTLELAAPNRQQARKLEAAFRKNAEAVYQSVMISLLEEEENEEEPKKKPRT